MIVVTGAAGFIGSCLVSKLNSAGFTNLILVDDFSDTQRGPKSRGSEAYYNFHNQASPFRPNTNLTGPGSEYKGIGLYPIAETVSVVAKVDSWLMNCASISSGVL